MSITVTGRKMPVTDALREYAEEKIGNSMKVMDIDPLVAEVVLFVEKNPANPVSYTHLACAGSTCTRSSLTATPRPHAAPSAAADFTKLRRVMVGCVMFPPSSRLRFLVCLLSQMGAPVARAAIGQRFTRPGPCLLYTSRCV